MAAPSEVTSHSVEETRALGEAFARELHGGTVVALVGALGSGKTQFVKGLCKGLGYTGVVSSPTFALINEYSGTPTVYHVDLYRLETAAQVRALGLEELMRADAIVVIEWPEAAAALLPPSTRRVQCAHGADDDTRIITFLDAA